jgi:DNA-directed RNA polymerase specialized sigma subunit
MFLFPFIFAIAFAFHTLAKAWSVHEDRLCCRVVQTYAPATFMVRQAKHALLYQYSGYIGSIVKSLYVPKRFYQELYDDGAVGFLKAVQKYDTSSTKGRLSTFAKMYVVDAVHKGKSRLRPMTLVSHHIVMSAHRVKKARYKIYMETGAAATPEQLKSVLPYSTQRINQLIHDGHLTATVESCLSVEEARNFQEISLDPLDP